MDKCNAQYCVVSSDCRCVIPALFLLCPQFPLKSHDYVFVRRLQVKRNGSLIVLINRYVGSDVLVLNCKLLPSDYLLTFCLALLAKGVSVSTLSDCA